MSLLYRTSTAAAPAAAVTVTHPVFLSPLGLAIAPHGKGVYFVDDATDKL